MAAPTCATFLAVGPSRSRRPSNEACKVAGTASEDGGTAAIDTWPRSAPASTTALVISSTKSGTPSVRSTIIRRQCPEIAAEPMHEDRPFIAVEPVQRDHRHLRPSDPRGLELGAVGCGQQHRQIGDLLDRKVEHLARGRIDPMQVLEDHQYRLPQ